MLNNDISSGNIFKLNDKLVVVDFNIASENYLVDELAWIISWFFVDTARFNLISPFLKSYQKFVHLNECELELLTFMPLSYSYLRTPPLTSYRTEHDCVKRVEEYKEAEVKLVEWLTL